MVEIRHESPATVRRARAHAFAHFADAVHEFGDEPTLVNFERYRRASQRLEAMERLAAASGRQDAPAQTAEERS